MTVELLASVKSWGLVNFSVSFGFIALCQPLLFSLQRRGSVNRIKSIELMKISFNVHAVNNLHLPYRYG